jgi:hypothetical protein
MQTSEIRNYKEIVLRRKYRIIIPVLLSILGGMVYFLQAPKVYEAVINPGATARGAWKLCSADYGRDCRR